MRRSILSLFLVVAAVGMQSCSYFAVDEEPQSNVKVPRDLPVWAEVDTYDLIGERGWIEFEKNGTVVSKAEAYVSPEIVGNVEELFAMVGKSVGKGDVLAVLGNSAAIEMSDLQESVAGESLGIAEELVDDNYVLQGNQVRGAAIAVQTSWSAYRSAVESRNEAQDVFELQVDGAELNVDRANEAYDDSSDDYEELEEEIDGLESDLDAMEEDNLKRAALVQEIALKRSQLEQMEVAMEAQEDAVTMAENGVEMLEEGYDTQLVQLNSAVDLSFKQYQAAVNQYNSAIVGADVQALNSDLQLLQAQSGYSAAQIGAEGKYVKAPISGIVTEVLAKVGNLVAPGQMILKIENPSMISVKSAVSLEEAKFLEVGDLVRLVSREREAAGKILSISPVLNPMTHKIDVEIEVMEDSMFVSGEMVKVKFGVERKSALFLPLTSIDVAAGGQFVRVVNVHGKVEFRFVKMGQVFGDFVEILDGLRGNEEAIVSPGAFIEEGQRVNVKAKKIER